MPGLLARLDAAARERLKSAYAPKSQGPLGSALSLLARFADSCPERDLFVRPLFRGDIEASAHNEWTLILIVWFAVTEPSPTTGKPLAVDSIRSYVSLLKGYLSHSYAFDVVDRTTRLSSLLKDLSVEQPLGGVRKKRRGFRRRHLRRLWERSEAARALTVDAVNDYALVATAWHTFARGGELAPDVTVDKWRADVHPVRSDLSFHVRRCGRRHAVLWLRPLKKKGKAPAPKVPQYIEEYDGGGSDTYAALARLVEHDPVPQELRATTPLFRRRVARRGGGGGAPAVRHTTVPQMRETVRRFAQAAGVHTYVKAHWGAHSCRIGGATDLASTGKASQLLLRAKGRWSSDIGAIYARLTQRSLLAASRLMQKARGRDLEEIIPSFVQPA